MCPGDWFPLGLQTRALGWIQSEVGCCMVSIIFDELKHFTLKSGFLAFLEKARLKPSFSAQQYAAYGQLRWAGQPCEVVKAVHCTKAPGRQGKWKLNLGCLPHRGPVGRMWIFQFTTSSNPCCLTLT